MSQTQINGSQVLNGTIAIEDLNTGSINNLYPSLIDTNRTHSTFLCAPITNDGAANFRSIDYRDLPNILLTQTSSLSNQSLYSDNSGMVGGISIETGVNNAVTKYTTTGFKLVDSSIIDIGTKVTTSNLCISSSLYATGSVRLDVPTVTSGAFSDLFARININGTIYSIPLYS